MAVRLPHIAFDTRYDLDVLRANVDSLVASSRRADVQCALFVFCRSGDTLAATWLADRFALTVHNVRGALANNRALQGACMYGHLSTAQWLTDRFELTADDARAGDNYALRWACASGHLSTAQWLADQFALTDADARAIDNYALRGACNGGHLGVAQWLVAQFGLTAHDIRTRDNSALQSACATNNVALARFILAPVTSSRATGMGATPPQAFARVLFLAATRRGRHELAQVLVSYAGLDNAWLAVLAAHAAPQR
jgi:hypothetical protein